jgi:hypothetical protein
VATGVSQAGLTKWADGLPGGFRPVAVSARVGAAQPVFDAIAVSDGGREEWRLHITPIKRSQDRWVEMRTDAFRRDIGFLFRTAEGAVTEGSVWVKDEFARPSEGYIRDRKEMSQKLAEFRDARDYHPPNLTAAGESNDTLYEVNVCRGPAVEWEVRLELTAAELAREAAAFRRKDWRPEKVGAWGTTAGTRYFAVFVKHDPKVERDFQTGLSLVAFETALKEKKAKNLRPASLVSEAKAKGVEYTVVWVEYSRDKMK